MKDLQRINKTQLIKGMHDLSLEQQQVYVLDTIIQPFRIEWYKLEGERKIKVVDISVPAGRLSLPVAYSHVILDVPETLMWSYFVDHFARGGTVPEEWRPWKQSGFHTDWNAYLRRSGHPVSHDFELLRMPTNFEASLVNNHNVYEEAYGTSVNGVATALNSMICDYFVIRDRFEKDLVKETYSDFVPGENRYFSIEDKDRQKLVLRELREFHDQVKRNVMSYFTPK